MRNFFNKIYGDLHTFVQARLLAKMAIIEAIYIRQCCDILQGLIDGPDFRKYDKAYMIFSFTVIKSNARIAEKKWSVDFKKLQLFSINKRTNKQTKIDFIVMSYCCNSFIMFIAPLIRRREIETQFKFPPF